MATDAGADTMEPVIVSSSRFNDLGPYCRALIASDKIKWGSIMTFDFPENGTKEVEQEFLRKFFPDREIRMQGGAEGDGEGFKFLKQVWQSIAIYNQYDRVPQESAKWFRSNTELLEDPKMRSYILSPEVQPLTFFNELDLHRCGPKFLGHVIQDIQGKLAPPEQSLEYQRNAALAARAKSASPPGPPIESSATFFSPQTTKRVVSDPIEPVVASTEPRSSPLTTSAGSAHALVQQRNITNETREFREPPRRVQPPRDLPSSNTVNHTSHGHAPPLRVYKRQDARVFSQQSQEPYGSGDQAIGTSGASFQQRGQSTTFVPGDVEFAPPMRGHQGAELSYQQVDNGQQAFPPYAQYTPQMQAVPASFTGYPARAPEPEPFYSSLPFLDRSKYPAPPRSFSNNSQTWGYQDQTEYQDDQRRDSAVGFRPSKSQRGRGGRGRGKTGSFGQGDSNRRRHELFNPYESGPSYDEHRSMSFKQKATGYHGHADSRRNENVNPTRLTGARADSTRQNERMHYHGPHDRFNADDVRSSQVLVQDNSNRALRNQYQHRRKSSILEPMPCGCTKYAIGRDCTSATKLVVFGVPISFPAQDVAMYFAQFGQVTGVWPSTESQYLRNQEDARAWVDVAFSDVHAARRALSQRFAPWVGGAQLMIEVARDHVYSYARKDYRAPNVPHSAPSMAHAPPMYGNFQQDRQFPDNTHRASSLGETTIDTTPFVLAAAPKDKKKGKSKKLMNDKENRKDSGPQENLSKEITRPTEVQAASDVPGAGALISEHGVAADEAPKGASPSEELQDQNEEPRVIEPSGDTKVSTGGALKESADAKADVPEAIAELPLEQSESAEVKNSDAEVTVTSETNTTKDKEATANDVEIEVESVVETAAADRALERDITDKPKGQVDSSKSEDISRDDQVPTAEVNSDDGTVKLADGGEPSSPSKTATVVAAEGQEQQDSSTPDIRDESESQTEVQADALLPTSVNTKTSEKPSNDSVELSETSIENISGEVKTKSKQIAEQTTLGDKPAVAPSQPRKWSTLVAVPSIPPISKSHTRSTASTSKISNDASEITPAVAPKAAPEPVTQTEATQRTVSDSSAPDSGAAFVTAPSTPLIPDPAPEVKSKKQLKKELKEKGPAQTESLSLFSKPNKKKSNKGGSLRGRPTALTPLKEVSRSLSAVTETSSVRNSQTSEQTKVEQRNDKTPAAPQPVNKSGDAKSAKQVSELDKNRKASGKGKSKAKAEKEKGPVTKDDVVSSPPSPARGFVGNIKALLGINHSPKPITKLADTAKDDVPPITLDTPGVSAKPEPASKAKNNADEGGSPAGLGIEPFPAPASAPADGEAKAKKKRKKSKPKSKQAKEATAEVTQMSFPVTDYSDPSSTPIHEYRGNDAKSDASSQTIDLVDLGEYTGPPMGPPHLRKQEARSVQVSTISEDEARNTQPETGVTQTLQFNNDHTVTKTSEETWTAVMLSAKTIMVSPSKETSVDTPETPQKTIEGPPDEQETSPEVEKSRQKLRELEREEEMKKAAKKSEESSSAS